MTAVLWNKTDIHVIYKVREAPGGRPRFIPLGQASQAQPFHNSWPLRRPSVGEEFGLIDNFSDTVTAVFQHAASTTLTPHVQSNNI